MVIRPLIEAFCWIILETGSYSSLFYTLTLLSSFLSNLIVWVRAAANRHYLVTLTSLMLILTTCLGPLAAALLNVKSTWLQEPGACCFWVSQRHWIRSFSDITMANLAEIGLNQNVQFDDLTSMPYSCNHPLCTNVFFVSITSFSNCSRICRHFRLV